MTELASVAQQQRSLALKLQDSSFLSGFPISPEDDSHLDLTARIRFLEACGGNPPFMVERIDEAGNVDRYSFERPFLLVGRSEACDISCRVRTVSYRHLYLQYLNGVVWWFDLDSRTGSLCDGQKRRAGCLVPGMTLKLGDQTLRLIASNDAGPQDLSRSQSLSISQEADLPDVYLQFENGRMRAEGEEGKRWKIENAVTLLGRRSCCDIRFTDDSVSRVHSSLVLTQDGLWIVDLLGRAGTRVNGNLSAYAYLHEDSLIEIGNYKIRVRYERHGRPHPAEAVLDKEDKTPKFAQSGGGGGVSEELLYTLVNNMAQMQKQMYDQSQQQVGMLIQMLGSFHQSQQELLREELARVREITWEMQQIKSQLGLAQPSPQAASQERIEKRPYGEASETPAPPPVTYKRNESTYEAPRENPLTAANLYPLDLEVPDEPPPAVEQPTVEKTPPQPKPIQQPVPAGVGEEALPRAKSNEVQEHALLFQRMQSLDRERNSRFQKILRAITGAG